MPDFLDRVGDEVAGRQKSHEMNRSRRDVPLADMKRVPPATFVLINLKKLDTSSIFPSTPPSQSKNRLRQLNQMDDLVQLTKPIFNEMNPEGRTHVPFILAPGFYGFECQWDFLRRQNGQNSGTIPVSSGMRRFFFVNFHNVKKRNYPYYWDGPPNVAVD